MIESDTELSRQRRHPMPMLFALSATVLVGATGCDLPLFGTKAPVSKQASDTLRLWQGFFIASGVVGAIVVGLITFAVLRYRRRSDDIPSQKSDNPRIEFIYTTIPILAVIVLFVLAMAVEGTVTRTDPRPDLIVEVTSYQWGWRFDYPDRGVSISGSGIENPPVLVLPEGKTARLRLHSLDVIHSFWVPALLQKRDMIPGRVNTMDVTPTKLGTSDGKCAEFCSLDHGRMIFTLEVVRPADFNAALERAQQEATP